MTHICGEHAEFRYTWPGRNEAYVCEKHAMSVRNVATAMGFYVQLIRLTDDELKAGHTCTQEVEERNG